MGKSRLSPLKPVTIPRMELSASVLSTRLDRMIRQELDIVIHDSFFWTDSTCVLRYVTNDDRRYKTFVANRVAAIREHSMPSQWKYVGTKANPADDASRGLTGTPLYNVTAGQGDPSSSGWMKKVGPRLQSLSLKRYRKSPRVTKLGLHSLLALPLQASIS